MPDQPIAKQRLHPVKAAPPEAGQAAPTPPKIRYAELHCVTNFTFQRGASHPDELVLRAAELGYRAIAVTDEGSLAGVVRAHVAAKKLGMKLLVGAEARLEDGATTILIARDRAGYGNLSKLITTGRRRAEKGQCRLFRKDVEEHAAGLAAVGVPDEDALRADSTAMALQRAAGRLAWLAAAFGGRAHLAAELFDGSDDAARIRRLDRLSQATGLPLVAAGAVDAHVPARRALRDVLLAIGNQCTVAELGARVPRDGVRAMRTAAELDRVFGARPELLERSVAIADGCSFSLDELKYEYPVEGDGGRLRQLVEENAAKRWPAGMPAKVRALVEHEMTLIRELDYERYFLTVHELVTFARSRGILCQGRGSAANSAVCFILGVTSVDPERIDVLFERFVSRDRNEPPDIDVDFEHERREEVLQHVYERYGRDRAALAATVITYRARSAMRDVGKALGLTLDQVDRLASTVHWWEGTSTESSLRESGFDPRDATLRRTLLLASEIQGFPRHLSQHVGGMVITAGRLDEIVPIENAAMEDRTVIQWDKDDLDALGLLKVDCLALGMLTAIRRAFDYVRETGGPSLTLDAVPAEDPEVYRMLGRADTIGVFQIESRAQMAMLPRLRPTCFYDLVIEVAIVRPGPIQGGMVHPYLRRREGLEPVVYPSEAVRSVLEKTLGVPIFQEQAMRIAVVAAGFTPGEADQLRRAMGAWRRAGVIEGFEKRLIEGMISRGYDEVFARAVFKQILGFGEYGFPECVVGATRIVDADTGRWVRIDDLVTGRVAVTSTLTCSDDLRIEKRRIVGRKASGRKAVFRVVTALGRAIVATGNHPFLTSSGWTKLAQLKVGDAVACARSIANSDVYWHKIVSIEPAGMEETYDLEIEGNHNFLANGFVVHNSHAASFALLTYVSSWLKRYEPACFTAALLNSQPMGFYAPAQLVRDARDHGVDVRPVDVTASNWDATLEGDRSAGFRSAGFSRLDVGRVARPLDSEPCPGERPGATEGQSSSARIEPAKAGAPALRLGFRLVKGLSESSALRIVAARDSQRFLSVEDCCRRAQISTRESKILADAGAFRSLSGHRREAWWDAALDHGPAPLLAGEPVVEPAAILAPPTLAETVVSDYRTCSLSLEAHPVSLIRADLAGMGCRPNASLRNARHGDVVRIAGLVINRQRPGTASGIIFMTLEDESGFANLIVRVKEQEKFRHAILGSRMMLVHGRVERAKDVVHVLLLEAADLTSMVAAVETSSRDFH
jgi:error-prone DNA polymerase